MKQAAFDTVSTQLHCGSFPMMKWMSRAMGSINIFLMIEKESDRKNYRREMSRKHKNTKLDVLNQTRDRTPMPRPAVFRDKRKYDRNTIKEADRKEQEESS